MSKRTKVLFWLYSLVLAVAVALVLWLIAVLAAYYLFEEVLPHPRLVHWLTIAIVPLLVLRMALVWSTKRDRPKTT